MKKMCISLCYLPRLLFSSNLLSQSVKNLINKVPVHELIPMLKKWRFTHISKCVDRDIIPLLFPVYNGNIHG